MRVNPTIVVKSNGNIGLNTITPYVASDAVIFGTTTTGLGATSVTINMGSTLSADL